MSSSWEESRDLQPDPGLELEAFSERDPLEWIRQRKDMSLRGGEFSAVDAATRIAAEALATGSRRVTIEHHGDWWIIWSKQDWLSGADHRRAFRTVVRHPFLTNSMRQEVLLTAFARNMVSACSGEVDVVKGEVDAELHNILFSLEKAERVVAFRVWGPVASSPTLQE